MPLFVDPTPRDITSSIGLSGPTDPDSPIMANQKENQISGRLF